MAVIVGKQGDQRVSITDPHVSRKHCKLTEQPDGSYLLEDLGSSNGTFVDGNQILKTRVTLDTIIQLGPNYKNSVRVLVGYGPGGGGSGGTGGSGSGTNPEPPEFSVLPLQYVWDEYQRELDEIKEKQKSINMLRSASPVFTMGSGALAGLAKYAEWGNAVFAATTVLTIAGLVLMVYAFIKSSRDDSDERRKQALDKFQSHYLCPNPKCGRSLAQSPKILLINKTCPYCKCKFTE